MDTIRKKPMVVPMTVTLAGAHLVAVTDFAYSTDLAKKAPNRPPGGLLVCRVVYTAAQHDRIRRHHG